MSYNKAALALYHLQSILGSWEYPSGGSGRVYLMELKEIVIIIIYSTHKLEKYESKSTETQVSGNFP